VRSYKKVWVDADYTGNGLVYYTEDQVPFGGNTTPGWVGFPQTKQQLVDSLNIIFSALHRGVTLDPYEVLFGTRLLDIGYSKHMDGFRKN
jgi:hypothetical protein